MEDKEIIDLYWARAETAIEETSKKYGRYCKTIAFRILDSDEDAEECVNDTYMGAWNAMPPQRPSRLLAFLGKITRNLALDRYDYRSAKKRGGGFDLVLSELEDCIPSQDNVAQEYEGSETAKTISSFLKGIDPIHRNVFLRRYWFADSIGDISVRFDMSESKVKSMLFRTRNKLKEHLEKEGTTI